MQTQLPRRPYVELPPPPDGLVSARREASRRRTRRAIASVTGGVSAVVLVVAGVLLTGGGGVAVLRPAPVAPATRLPTPGSSVAPSAAAGAHRGGAAVSSVRASGRSASPAPATASRSGVMATSSQAGHFSSSAVQLTRQPGRNPDAPNVCRTGISSDNQTTHVGDDWCTAATAVAVAGGERLSYRLCRDSTTGGTLHFAGSREVELTVSRNGSTVWRYSAHVTDARSPHTLTAAADDCWTWSLVWPGTTDSGAAAPRGRYALNATSTANELVGAPVTTATFDF